MRALCLTVSLFLSLAACNSGPTGGSGLDMSSAGGADLWFVSLDDTPKIRDLRHDPHLNLSYYKDRTREWVSVSGVATLTTDRATIHALYAPDWKVWFPKGDDPRHGTADDPRIVLIGVDVHAAVFLEVDKPAPVVLFEMVKGWVTGDTPDVGEMHHIERRGGQV